jgi:sugar transferase (PEP-CTERM/EpsH1 system associated)
LKLLFLANRTPYPPYRGDKLKIYNLARQLSAHHELHLLTFAQSEEDERHIPELKKYFTEVHLVPLPFKHSLWQCVLGLFSPKPFQVSYFHAKAMQQKLQEWIQIHQYDAVHIQHIRMAPYMQSYTHIPRILDLPDAFSLYWQRRVEQSNNFIQKIALQWEQRRLYAYESIISQFPLTLVCSEEDLSYLQQKHPDARIALLPNGVDLDTFRPREHNYTIEDTVLFTGNMDYAPNVDAVVYFVHEIFPEIRKRRPGVKFIIAGQRPVDKVKALASEDITITGFVQDLVDVYHQASVVVSPLRFGAGTQNKVLEAMALGIPVVCSHIGFKGLGIQSGEGAFLATNKDEFVAQVTQLLADQSLRREMGSQGIQQIEERFGWTIIAQRLEGYFQQVAHQAPVSDKHPETQGL